MNSYETLDAEKLIAEIERRIELICTTEGLVRRDKLQEYETLRDIEDLIISLQQEKLLAVVPGFLDRNYHEEIRFSINNDSFTGDSALLLPEDSVSFEDLGYDGPIEVELLIRKV